HSSILHPFPTRRSSDLYGFNVQAKGMRPVDSRLSAVRASSPKYSTSARSRTCGLSAARRAMPTSFLAGGSESAARLVVFKLAATERKSVGEGKRGGRGG